MCFRPLHIRNKSFDPSNPHSCEFVDVPCGHCPECLDHINNEYAFRVFMHTDYILRNGGSVFFVTLTYQTKYLPILTFKTKNGNIRTCSTWNKHHLRRFVRDLRNLLLSSKLSYLFVTERGSSQPYKDDLGHIRTGTARPHYHGILWISNIGAEKFNIEQIERLITKCWTYGRVDFQALTRSPQSATKYITKYMGKQSSDITQLIPINQIISHNHQSSKFDGLIFSDSQFKPFKLISKNIGSSFVPSKEQLEGTARVSFDGREFNLPRYYQKRYFKQLDNTYARPSDIVTIRPKWTKDLVSDSVSYRQVYVPKVGYCKDGNPDFPINSKELRYSSKTLETPSGSSNLDVRFLTRIHRLAVALVSFDIHHVDICGLFRLYDFLKTTPAFIEYFNKHIIDLSDLTFTSTKVYFRGHDVAEFTLLITNTFDYDSFTHYLPPLLRECKADRNLLDFYGLYTLYNRCNQSINALKNHSKYKSKFSEMLAKKPVLFQTQYKYEQLPELDD